MRKPPLVASLCLVLCLGSLATASDIYNTTSTNVGAVVNNPWSTSFRSNAQKFQTTTDHFINYVSFLWEGTGATGTVNVTINADNNSSPGTQVASVGSFSLATLTGNNPTPISFSSLNINLSASTNYWLIFSGSNVTSGASIRYSSSTTGVGGPFVVAEDTGSGWTTYNNTGFIGQITATSVPEPSTYALAAIAGLTLAGIARRRNGKNVVNDLLTQMKKSSPRILKKRLAASLCLLLGLGSMASGADIFKSLGTQFDGYWSLAVTPNVTALAQAFQTDSNHVVNLVSFDWVGQNATGTVTVSIAGDNAGVPGTQVSPVGSFDLAPLVNLDETFITFSSLNINLAANSNYWIVFTPSNLTGSAGPVWTSSPTGTAPFTMASNSNASGWTTYANKAMLGQISASVPEPSALALGSIAALVVARRRKARSKQA